VATPKEQIQQTIEKSPKKRRAGDVRQRSILNKPNIKG